jgi:hypothetical protein
MRESEIDPFDPFNLGNERYYLWVDISNQFVNIVGAGVVRGRAVRIKIKNGPDSAQWYPTGLKLGIWTKGQPADIEYDQIPPELKVIDIRHIASIKVDVNQMF